VEKEWSSSTVLAQHWNQQTCWPKSAHRRTTFSGGHEIAAPGERERKKEKKKKRGLVVAWRNPASALRAREREEEREDSKLATNYPTRQFSHSVIRSVGRQQGCGSFFFRIGFPLSTFAPGGLTENATPTPRPRKRKKTTESPANSPEDGEQKREKKKRLEAWR